MDSSFIENMKAESGKVIMGVSLTTLRQTSDTRGSVLHMLRSDDPEFINFGECYFSEILPGSVKAWKRHRRQTQTLAVPVGRVFMVMYDDREISDTPKQLQTLELGRPESYVRVRIPPGVWYGFACLSSTPALLVNCVDMPHDPNESDLCPLGDSTVPYQWKVLLT